MKIFNSTISFLVYDMFEMGNPCSQYKAITIFHDLSFFKVISSMVEKPSKFYNSVLVMYLQRHGTLSLSRISIKMVAMRYSCTYGGQKLRLVLPSYCLGVLAPILTTMLYCNEKSCLLETLKVLGVHNSEPHFYSSHLSHFGSQISQV